MFSTAKLHCGRSTKGPRTVRLSSVHPASFGYTDGLSTEQVVDGPPMVRGWSAVGEKNLPQAVPVGCWIKFFRGGRSAPRVADSLLLRRAVGSAIIDLYRRVPFISPTNPHQTSKSSPSFFLKHMGETTRSRLFGVIPGWSDHIPGLFSRLYIMSSRYFDESLTLVLGFLHWKELGLGAPICFFTMDS